MKIKDYAIFGSIIAFILLLVVLLIFLLRDKDNPVLLTESSNDKSISSQIQEADKVSIIRDKEYDYQQEYEDQEHVREHFESADEYGTKVPDNDLSTFTESSDSDTPKHVEEHSAVLVSEQYSEAQDVSGNASDLNHSNEVEASSEEVKEAWSVYTIDDISWSIQKGDNQEVMMLLGTDHTTVPDNSFKWSDNVFYQEDELTYYIYVVKDNYVEYYSLSRQTPYFEEIMDVLYGILF